MDEGRRSGRRGRGRTRAWSAASALGLLLVASRGDALPILSVDLDPDAPGVQPARSVALGAIFDVHVVVEGVDAASPLNAFELDLSHPAQLTALAASLGSFLPLPRLVIENDITAPDVNLAAVALGAVGGTGQGVLAVVTLRADGLGASLLALDDVLLSAPFGVPIAVGELRGATVAVVPEAGTAACVALGAGALAGARRRRTRIR